MSVHLQPDYEWYSTTSSITTMVDALQWPTLETRRENHHLVLMYKIIQGLVAVPSTKLIPADDRTRSNHQYKFRVISGSSSAYKNSFFPSTIPAWNALPSTVVDCNTIDSFKHNLYKSPLKCYVLSPSVGYPSMGVC